MTKSRQPLVSIVSLVFNHKDFIVKALESWLMQRTTFEFEIIIGEDFSTDGSREIVFDYAKKYPDIVKVITSDSNVGMRENSLRAKNASKGKYIAFCEGDDYWIDPLKLQKQADFMEANPDFSLCFHDAVVVWEDKSRQPSYFCSKDQKEITGPEDIIKKWYIPTASMFMKKEFIVDSPDWLVNVYNGDWATQMILSTKGKIKYINTLMSVYRKNSAALTGTAYERTEYIIDKKIELLNYFNEYTKGKYEDSITIKISELQDEVKSFKLRKNKILFYWLKNPRKTLLKVSQHLLDK